jgi:hypothetical protein
MGRNEELVGFPVLSFFSSKKRTERIEAAGCHEKPEKKDAI